MANEGFKRKLTAILSADVEGYSRHMDDDEEATVRTLTTYRNAITDLTQQLIQTLQIYCLTYECRGLIKNHISANIQFYETTYKSG